MPAFLQRANLAGFAVVALVVGLAMTWLKTGWLVGVIAFLMAAPSAYYLWNRPSMPSDWRGWLCWVLAVLAVCGAMALIDIWLFPQSEGALFFDAFCAFIATMAGLSGMVRSICLPREG